MDQYWLIAWKTRWLAWDKTGQERHLAWYNNVKRQEICRHPTRNWRLSSGWDVEITDVVVWSETRSQQVDWNTRVIRESATRTNQQGDRTIHDQMGALSSGELLIPEGVFSNTRIEIQNPLRSCVDTIERINSCRSHAARPMSTHPFPPKSWLRGMEKRRKL